MDDKESAGFRWGRFVFGLLCVFFCLAAAVFVNTLGGLNYHLDRFSFYVRNHDKQVAVQELQALKYYQTQFHRWKMDFVSDRIVASNMVKYEAAVALLEEDFEKVIESEELKNLRDDYLVSHMVAIAKFRILQAEYQKTKSAVERNKIVQMVMDQVRPDFEKAVRNGPGFYGFFDGSYNYDITSDPDNTKKALQNPKLDPKYILGRGDKDGEIPSQGEPGKKDPLGDGQSKDRDTSRASGGKKGG